MSHDKLLKWAFGILAVGLLVLPSSASDYSYARIVRLSYVEGAVQVSRPHQDEWEAAALNMPIGQGFVIATQEGRAEIEFEDGSTARMSSNTVLQFTELALSDGGPTTRLALTQGTASFTTQAVKGDTFTVTTPRMDVALTPRTSIRLDVSGTSSVVVFRGNVNLNSFEGSRKVLADETAKFSNALGTVSVSPNPPEDEWDSWVDSRQSVLANGAAEARQYTDAPVNYGMADLTSYGSWNYLPGFGYGWQPFGLAAGWAPFSQGGWGFYSGLGWTWLSSEPWGWLPYHFGNWEYNPVFGWLWFPGFWDYWCPAPVRWYGGGGRIGWGPIIRSLGTPVGGILARQSSAGMAVSAGFRGANPVHGPFGSTPTISEQSGGLGGNGPIRVLSPRDAKGIMQPLELPPLPDGKAPKVGAQINALAFAAGVPKGGEFRGVPSAVVPTFSGLREMHSGVIYDPVESRFMPGNGALTGERIAPVTINGAPRVTRGPVVPLWETASGTSHGPSYTGAPRFNGPPSMVVSGKSTSPGARSNDGFIPSGIGSSSGSGSERSGGGNSSGGGHVGGRP
jgi:hypothetical protein